MTISSDECPVKPGDIFCDKTGIRKVLAVRPSKEKPGEWQIDYENITEKEAENGRNK